MSLLSKSKIISCLPQNLRGDTHIELLDKIDSTNDYLLKNALCAPHYHAVFAEQQTQGRGRSGRIWVSPHGHNIYLSIAFFTTKKPFELSGLSLATGVAIIRALKAYGVAQTLNVKWPNDIFYENKKLAGTLIDIKPGTDNSHLVVIGIGINTFLSADDTAQIDQPATSLHDMMHTQTDRNHLAALLIAELIIMTQQFKHEGLTPFLNEWRAHDIFTGHPVTLKNSTQTITGIMEGIKNDGALLIKDNQQKTHVITSGDVSLRKT